MGRINRIAIMRRCVSLGFVKREIGPFNPGIDGIINGTGGFAEARIVLHGPKTFNAG